MNQQINPVSNRILRLKQVIELCQLSRSTIYEKLNTKSNRYDPTFPRPFKLGLSAIGWIEQDIAYWIESRKS